VNQIVVTARVEGRANVLAHVSGRRRETVAVAQRPGDERRCGVCGRAYYYRYSDAQIRDHYLALLGSVTAPVYAYTIPDRTGNTLACSVVRELAAAGLKGVKDSSKSLAVHREYLGVGIDVLMGSDALVLESLRLGATGAVSAIANIEPALLLELARCFALEQARPLQAQIVAIRERTRALPSAIAAMKGDSPPACPGIRSHARPLSWGVLTLGDDGAFRSARDGTRPRHAIHAPASPVPDRTMPLRSLVWALRCDGHPAWAPIRSVRCHQGPRRRESTRVGSCGIKARRPVRS
jgi:hypothetical protein